MSTAPAQNPPTTSTQALLSELPEAEARGAIAQIYDEIRQLSAVPMVALIWRHLATLPGTLEWAWALLAPAMRAGVVQQVAAHLAAKARVAHPRSIPAAALRACGISEADQRGITEVLHAYNRANPVNIVMVRCLSLHLSARVGSINAQPWPHWQTPEAPPKLPPMVNPEAMSPTVRAMALLLTNRGAQQAPSTLWPSLYRHLAHWPAFLGLATVLVPTEFEAIDAVAARMRHEVDRAAEDIAARLSISADRPVPVTATGAALQSAIDQFSGRIPEMVVIGNLLQDALPSSAP